MSMIDCKGMIVSLLERIDSVREEKVSAGTKYRLMGLVADIAEVAQGLQEKVLARVLRGSYNQIAKLLDMDGENPATLAKYLGMGKKQPYADWIVGYVQGASSD